MIDSEKLIVLEGLDGAGKSTQINLIEKYLEEKNLKYKYIHFPIYDNNEASKIIAAYLRGEYGDINEVNPIFVANIYAMERYLYLPILQKMLMENDVILLDRYVFSNMAYQGAKYNTETQAKIMRDWINEYEFGFLELPYPNLTIFLDTLIDSVEDRLNKKRKGEDRKYLNGKSDIHEKDINFQIKVRDNYLSLKDYQGYQIIECFEKKTYPLPETEKGKKGFKEITEIFLDTPEDTFKKYEKYLDNILFNKPIKNG